MIVTVRVELREGDALEYTPTEAAAAILAELGGDPLEDVCTVQVVQDHFGTAGTPATPPESDLTAAPE